MKKSTAPSGPKLTGPSVPFVYLTGYVNMYDVLVPL